MARKAKRAARRPRSTPSGRARPNSSADPKARLVAAALKLAAERSWARVTFADIARAARLPLAEAIGSLSSKTAVLAEFQRGIDRTVLAGGEAGEGGARDRLFELLMRRFDALGPHRAALRSIARAAPLDPAALLCGWLQLLHSMRLTLAIAGCPAEGLVGLIAIKGLAGLYLSVLPVFLADRSRDHAATMAALDKRLRCIQSLADWVRGQMPKAT